MKKAIVYLCIAIFLAIVVQPNISVNLRKGDADVPENTQTTPMTNDSVDIVKSESTATICIDPAKGGNSSGYKTDDGLTEKEINLILAQAIGSKLTSAGYKVVYTRSDNSTTLSNSQRLQVAKKNKADYLICVSVNSDSTSSFTKGYSLFTQEDDTMIDVSKNISEQLDMIHFSEYQGLDSDHYENFSILKSKKIPSILLELGYLTNAEDFAQLTDSAYQQKIGSAIAQAFVEAIN